MQVPGLNLNSAGHYNTDADKGLLTPIASLLEGQYSRQALQVGLVFKSLPFHFAASEHTLSRDVLVKHV